MPRFHNRPRTVEAYQFFPPEGGRELPEGVVGVPSPGADNWNYSGCRFFVTTIHGQKTEIVAGDWVITEPDGVHHYPCKPDIFAASYQPE